MDVLEEPEEEGVLTAESVLRHAQAQGLQPVVDVRFSHRHLELCREKQTGEPRSWNLAGTLSAHPELPTIAESLWWEQTFEILEPNCC